MSDLAIRVDQLGKQYRIGGTRLPYQTLRDQLRQTLTAPWRFWRRPRPDDRRFWALRDVSFEVKRGDVVGIIGRNGAGKSTLLKILSRITEPTTGEVDLHGRVGSLLEVGTGFHPELTGRENVYLNGAILGMRREEIARKFDEIVAFAEVEKFIDTPVKHYSSGMYMRLAFAVAAHLEPEILVVDEVLAVGDAQFQEKCLGKMRSVAGQGRTVLFVSHNMQAIRQLCSRGVLLQQGKVAVGGSVDRCVAEYLRKGTSASAHFWRREPTAPQKALQIEAINAELIGSQPDIRLLLDVQLRSLARHKAAFCAVDISDASGTVLMQALPTAQPFISDASPAHRLTLDIQLPPLVPGQYSTTMWVGNHNTETLDQIVGCIAFGITESPTLDRTFPHSPDTGYIVPKTCMRYATVGGRE
jgi:lipopolysaccharide transport system ATP-binding protein